MLKEMQSKTHFKGATAFVLQANASIAIQKNDQAILSYLGIDGRTVDAAAKNVMSQTTIDK